MKCYMLVGKKVITHLKIKKPNNKTLIIFFTNELKFEVLYYVCKTRNIKCWYGIRFMPSVRQKHRIFEDFTNFPIYRRLVCRKKNSHFSNIIWYIIL